MSISVSDTTVVGSIMNSCQRIHQMFDTIKCEVPMKYDAPLPLGVKGLTFRPIRQSTYFNICVNTVDAHTKDMTAL